MPELPEVQTVVNSLQPWLTGCRLARLVQVRNDMVSPVGLDLASMVVNHRVRAITRRGKRIVFTLDNDNRWFIHLGMTGQLTVEPVDNVVRPHTHLIIDCEGGRQLRFVDPRRFGGIFWLGTTTEDDGIGPEPFALRSGQLYRRLIRTRRYIKTTLLDQRFIAGVGNIYADESLFLARIHPLTLTNEIEHEEARRLARSIKRVLKQAIRHGGSSLQDYIDANGNRGSFQSRHRVYDRAGEPCTDCKTLITRIVVSQRSTHFCPRCQKLRTA